MRRPAPPSRRAAAPGLFRRAGARAFPLVAGVSAAEPARGRPALPGGLRWGGRGRSRRGFFPNKSFFSTFVRWLLVARFLVSFSAAAARSRLSKRSLAGLGGSLVGLSAFLSPCRSSSSPPPQASSCKTRKLVKTNSSILPILRRRHRCVHLRLPSSLCRVC